MRTENRIPTLVALPGFGLLACVAVSGILTLAPSAPSARVADDVAPPAQAVVAAPPPPHHEAPAPREVGPLAAPTLPRALPAPVVAKEAARPHDSALSPRRGAADRRPDGEQEDNPVRDNGAAPLFTDNSRAAP